MKKFRDCIKEIVTSSGIDILSDIDRFKAYVGDLANDYPKERDYIINVCDDEWLSAFRIIDGTSIRSKAAVTTAKQLLIENKMTDAKWAERISNEVALGITQFYTKKKKKRYNPKQGPSYDERQIILDDLQCLIDEKRQMLATKKEQKVDKLKEKREELDDQISDIELYIDALEKKKTAYSTETGVVRRLSEIQKEQKQLLKAKRNEYDDIAMKYSKSFNDYSDTEKRTKSIIRSLERCMQIVKSEYRVNNK